jgi:plastocyanin
MIHYPGAPLEETLQRSATRRQVLRIGGLVVGLAAASSLVAACSSAPEIPTTVPIPASPPTPPPAPSPPPAPTAAAGAATPAAAGATTPTAAAGATTPAAAAPVAAASPTPAAAGSAALSGIPSTVSIQAKESGTSFLFDVDNLVVAAGTVKFSFKNIGKQTHELWLYPAQDVSKLVNLKRAGQDVTEEQYLKGLAGQTGEVQPGKSATFDAKLAPGFYELACYMVSGDASGTMVPHYDKGQTVTIAAVGPGGPAPSVINAAGTLNVQMVAGQGDLASSWLFVPDRLVVKPGDVVFSVTNKLTETHDFTVYPLGDVSSYVVSRFKGDDPAVGTVIKGAQEVLADEPAGQTMQKTMTLTAGMWAAACFMVSKNTDGTSFMHRDRGQRFSFLVKA